MMFTSYQIIYLVTSLFGTYIIYKLMRLFYDYHKSNSWIELASYCIYNIIITTLYFAIGIPLLLLIANFVAFIGLSLNYEAKFSKRILTAIYILVILASVEIVMSVASEYMGIGILESSKFDNSVFLVAAKLISYVLVLLLERYKNVKLNYEISIWNWIAVVGIPLSLLYIAVTLFQSVSISHMQLTISITSLILINIMVFSLYDALQARAYEKTEKKLLQQQNKHYINQYKQIYSSQETIKAMMHDWNNHLSVIENLVKEKNFPNLNKYIENIVKEKGKTCTIYTENLELDSILNFKQQQAIENEITCNIEVKIPEILELNAYDMTVLLGNLFDNAIEASEECKENSKRISVVIKYSKGRLFLQMVNSFENRIIWNKGLPTTDKSKKEDHGIGLKQVKRIVDKYSGNLEVIAENNEYNVNILLFLS
ncbi:MAG: GHKL domain-containing protein [Bacillota bacterium]|nr:GHKL domain-containing protein [Bacillota bacterium]